MPRAARLLARRRKSKGASEQAKKLQRSILLDAHNGARQILRLRSLNVHVRALLTYSSARMAHEVGGEYTPMSAAARHKWQKT